VIFCAANAGVANDIARSKDSAKEMIFLTDLVLSISKTPFLILFFTLNKHTLFFMLRMHLNITSEYLIFNDRCQCIFDILDLNYSHN